MSLTQGLQRALQQRPGSIATIFEGRRQTFAQLAARVARLAGALRALGVRRGDRVGILAMNSDRYVEVYLATWWLGAVSNPVNTRWSVAEIAYSLNDCDTGFLLVDDHFLPMVDALRKQAGGLHSVIHIDSGHSPTAPGVASYETILQAAEPVADVRADFGELAVICYTGGTTGYPKGVMLSHGNLWASAIARLAEAPVRGGSISLQVTPMFHVAGLGGVVTQGILGGTTVFLPGFSAQGVLQAISVNKVNNVMLVPTMIQMLIEHPLFKEYRLDSLQRMVYGASPIAEAVLDHALRVLPGVEFMQSYGMTEASPILAINPPENHTLEGRKFGKLRAAGKAGLSVELQIVDADGVEVPRNTVGEIKARGPNIMMGYWNKPKENAAVLRDGWYFTGDCAYMDEDGYIYVVDRLKDMIISGGENVYSAEVENAIGQHPAVSACAVIGIPSEAWGEGVHAVIVLRSGMSLTQEEIKAHCHARIAGYKCPKTVQFMDQLPLSVNGKVLKTVLREPFWKDRARAVG